MELAAWGDTADRHDGSATTLVAWPFPKYTKKLLSPTTCTDRKQYVPLPAIDQCVNIGAASYIIHVSYSAASAK